MQTFLPYKSFEESAKVLDRQRLGKQRLESRQILEILIGLRISGWKNHPAVKMWKGYELALGIYGEKICLEWRSRGYKDNQLDFFVDFLSDNRVENEEYPLCECLFPQSIIEMPPFVGNKEFHLSHQSNLVRKFPEHYRKFFPDVSNNLPYVWIVGEK